MKTLFFLFLFVCGHRVDASVSEDCTPTILSSSTKRDVPSKYTAALDLFVCPGMKVAARHLFVDVHLDLNLTDPKEYQLYQGGNCSSVQDAYDSENRLFGLLKSVSLWRSLQLDPFSRTIVGLETTQAYRIGLIVYQVSVWRACLFFGAIILYALAPWLVRNALVYYAGGCTTGALLSGLLLVFLLYRLAPKKAIGVPILIGGWSVAGWMAMHAWNNLSTLMVQYQKFVAAYLVTALVVSFAYFYRRGPPSDDRTLDVATWFMQALACALIYFSCQIPMISFATMGLLIASSLLLSDTSKTIFSFIHATWTYFFPTPRRLLTEEEFDREGAEFTKRELAKLRDYCRSPDANQWKIAMKTRTPTRLARFVEGEDEHVSMREERQYMDYMVEGEQFFEPREQENFTDDSDEREWEQEREQRYRQERRGDRSGSRHNTSSYYAGSASRDKRESALRADRPHGSRSYRREEREFGGQDDEDHSEDYSRTTDLPRISSLRPTSSSRAAVLPRTAVSQPVVTTPKSARREGMAARGLSSARRAPPVTSTPNKTPRRESMFSSDEDDIH